MDRKRKRAQSLDVNEMPSMVERRQEIKSSLEQREQRFQAKLKHEKQLDKFLTHQSAARNDELAEMHSNATTHGRDIASHDKDLAGYMLRRSAEGRQVEGADFANLYQGHQTVMETRQKLSRGRGNVTTDISKSKHRSTHFMDAGRELDTHLQKTYKQDYRISGASTAEFVRAGNCQEHADVTTHGHANRLKSNQSIHNRSMDPGDHVWSEVRNKDSKARNNDVILDAWAYGPAVLRDDAYFAQRPSGAKTQYKYNKLEVMDASKRVSSLNDSLAKKKWVGEFVSNRVSQLRKDKYKASGTFLPTSVLDKGFMARTDERMSKPVDLSKVLSRKQRKQVGGMDTKVNLRNEIKAVGVARQLGSNVRQASQQAPEIVLAAKNLPKNK